MERDVMEYDIIIVGAGPAGLSTAIKLAQENKKPVSYTHLTLPTI